MTDCVLENPKTVYVGHDNVVSVTPYSDITERVYYDMSLVTKVDASVDLITSTTTGDDITASSDDVPTTIWWEQIGTTDEWRIHLKIGLFVGISAGEYKLRIILYDTTYTNGLVLTDDTRVDVVGVP